MAVVEASVGVAVALALRAWLRRSSTCDRTSPLPAVFLAVAAFCMFAEIM
ncbi:hypothetical protein [Actinomadura soli]|nr:hypothetical protein [Actinomadura soli]